jgi:hypothetical protein
METQETARVVAGWREQLFAPVRSAIFGRQNERLEYLMDSYFKLSPEQRTAVVVGGVLAMILLLVGIISLYLSALSGLQSDLDSAFAATNKLKEVQTVHQIARQRYEELDGMLRDNANLSLITLIESKAKEMGVTVGDFPSQQEVAPPTAPLSNSAFKNHRVAKIRFSISKAGLKKIVEFVVELEKLKNRLRVTSLTIKRGFVDKLYLDASVEVEAIMPPAM